MSNVKKVVIIGGVAGGMSAASKAKRENPDLEVTVFERSHYISYGACGMPYVIGGLIPDLEKLVSRSPEEMAERGVEVKVRHEVTEIDHENRTVKVKNLESGDTFEASYDVLVLATGAQAIRPDLPGIDLENIYTLRRMEDAAAIAEAAEGAARAVIVGGGYIGLEMAEALTLAGLFVSVVEMSEHLLASVTPDYSDIARCELEDNDVDVYLNTEVTGFEGDGSVERVVMKTGEGEKTLDADLVIMAAGVKPNSELAKGLGVDLGPNDAVLTDEKLRTNVADIYAVGDATAVRHMLTDNPTWLPLGDTANKQGRVAGTVIAGKEASFKGVLGTAITKVFERAFATTGLNEQAAREAGFDAESLCIEDTDHAGYYPDKSPLTVTLVWEKGSQKLLGAQLAGYGDAVKRVDAIAALLLKGGTLADLADLDMAYAPPFSGVWDSLLVAANVALSD